MIPALVALLQLDAILKEANTPMNSHFHPDEVPEHLKDAARDCQGIRSVFEDKIRGPFAPGELPPFTLPVPVIDGQTLSRPHFNLLSQRQDGTDYYVAVGRQWVLVEKRRLTNPSISGML